MKSVSMILIFLSAITLGQVNKSENSGGHDFGRINEKWLFSPLEIQTVENETITGLLLGLKSDTLFYLFENKAQKILLTSIKKLKLQERNDEHKSLLAGFLAGAYIGTLLFFTEKNQSGWYLNSNSNLTILLIDILPGSLGALVQYAFRASPISNKAIFNFSQENMEDSAEEINKLYEFLNGGDKYTAKWHLFIQSSASPAAPGSARRHAARTSA